MKNKNVDYYNVPIYVEKTIKKLYKLKEQEKELALFVKDYMNTHNIPINTPLHFLKNIPEEEIDPNQIKFNFDENK